MNRTTATKWLSFVLCLALIAAIALTAMGCDQAKTPETPEIPEASGNAAVTTTEGGTTPETPDPNPPIVKGEGATVFYFNVVDKDGKETKFEIHTDKTVVGEALLELGLIEGDMGDYGLYVKKVNGITADYNEDSTWWGVEQNGTLLPTGMSGILVKDGDHYDVVCKKG